MLLSRIWNFSALWRASLASGEAFLRCLTPMCRPVRFRERPMLAVPRALFFFLRARLDARRRPRVPGQWLHVRRLLGRGSLPLPPIDGTKERATRLFVMLPACSLFLVFNEKIAWCSDSSRPALDPSTVRRQHWTYGLTLQGGDKPPLLYVGAAISLHADCHRQLC